MEASSEIACANRTRVLDSLWGSLPLGLAAQGIQKNAE